MSDWSVQIRAVNPDGTVTLDFEEFLRLVANQPITYTTTQISDATEEVNTTDKRVGKMIYNSSTGVPLWADGTTATSTWSDATGAVVITPS
jgi:hypothetical protein